MLEALMNWNAQVNAVVWGPPMLLAIVGTGIILTLRTGFAQFTRFRAMLAEVLGRRKGELREGDITPFQALTVAMGGTVGVGNIAGVATAIALGGPGAMFWMWVCGLLGMCTKAVEVVLGLHYRRREPGGPMVGGAMQYISRGMGGNWRWLAVLFCVFGGLAAFGIGNMVQANSVAHGLESFGVARWITGLILIVAVGLVTIGGIKRIAEVAMVVVPFMVGIYLLGCLAILVLRITAIPTALGLIFKHAFTKTAGIGGFAGATVMQAMRYGVARGVFSNEAGLGSAPMAHATAKTDHPARQGLWGIFEVFVDTIVVCSGTGLAIMLTGAWTSGETGAALTMQAFDAVFPGALGSIIVVLSMILTAYDTNLAWCFYGETCLSYLGGGRTRLPYRLIWLPLVMVGALGKLTAVWDIADTLNGLMAIPNVIALLALSGIAAKLMRDFRAGIPYEPLPEPTPASSD